MVEQLGSGIIRIINQYDKSIFKFLPNFLRITIPLNSLNETIKPSLETVKSLESIPSLVQKPKVYTHVLDEVSSEALNSLCETVNLPDETVKKLILNKTKLEILYKYHIILQSLQSKSLSTSELLTLTKVSRATIKRDMKFLESLKLITTIGKGKGLRYKLTS